MSLSDRLERAKRERLLAAGLLHSEAALKPEAEIDVTDDSFRMTDIEIEAHSAGLHPVAPSSSDTQMSEAPLIAGERSGDCPNCRRPGRVDMVDLVGHTVHMSCTTCGTMWRAKRSAASATAPTELQ